MLLKHQLTVFLSKADESMLAMKGTTSEINFLYFGTWRGLAELPIHPFLQVRPGVSLPSPDEAPGISPPSPDLKDDKRIVETPRPPIRWASMGYLHLARLVPQAGRLLCLFGDLGAASGCASAQGLFAASSQAPTPS